ncbi:MAG: site-specific integrase, partial [Candidatus Sericytochromatia bacterium]|nr:site-specific integrase [Candidatus Tanganyikabacteria bacterium]
MSALDEFLLYLTVERDLSSHTVDAYRSDLKQFIAFLGDRRPEEADYALLRKFAQRL